MTCHRAQQIDLLEFLSAPRRADFENFCQHYPRCPECSAELRAWTELQQILVVGSSAGHPEPEALERYDRAAESFAVGERRALEAHLAICSACREELHALRHHEPGRIATPDPERPRRRMWREAWGRLLRVVWHPAFAYALVGVLLFPLLYRTVAPLRDTEAPLDSSPALGSKASRPATPPPLARAPESPAAAESIAGLPRAAPEATMLRDAPRRELAEATPLAPAKRKTEAEERFDGEAPEEPLYHGVRTRELQGAMADLHERDIYVPTLRLHRGTLSRASESELAEGVLLEVPLPRDQPGGWASVRVAEERLAGESQQLARHSAGRAGLAEDLAEAAPRKLEEARAVEPMQRALVVHIPREWLHSGRYRIDLELRDRERTRVIGRGRYRLQVEAE